MADMRYRWVVCVLAGMVACGPIGSAQVQFRKVTEPAGKALDKALKASMLSQPGSKPFHVQMEIKQIKSPSGDYDASVEETWVSPTQWVRTVKAESVSQITVTNDSGTHYVTSGDYYPNWLRNFVTALFDPVPNAAQLDRMNGVLTHIEMPNGGGSNPELHGDLMLGVPPAQQVNFTDVDFYPDKRRIELALMPGYNMTFKDYRPFGKLQVARTLTNEPGHGIDLTGTVTVLEEVAAPDAKMFETPVGASDKDPLITATVDSAQMMKVGAGAMDLKWPTQIPGSGMFTVWLCLDKTGTIRELNTINTDLSGFAADMSAQLMGRKWKAPVLNGDAVQVMGPVVYAYPPALARP